MAPKRSQWGIHLNQAEQQSPNKKVAAFIIRARGALAELLVFHHLHSGLQVPAGTVEAGEGPDQAVQREVAEEAGLSDLAFIHLGDRQIRYQDGRCFVPVETALRNGPQPEADVLLFLERGWVRRTDEQGAHTQVCREHLDWDFDPPRVLAPPVCGWVESGRLWFSEIRSFYLAEAPDSLPDRWTVQVADGGVSAFRFRWLPLRPDIPLVSPQRAWLVDMWPQILSCLGD